MSKFLTENSTSYRLGRTIFQGIIGVIIANADIIVGMYVLDPTQRAMVVAFVMAVLSPIMSVLGGNGDDDEPEVA